MIDFRTEPSEYKHWAIEIKGRVATLSLNVQETGGLRRDYDLKRNSYDLGVDIELYDATQRLRFEYPQVAAVVITSTKDRVFCAGANIRMLAGSSHEEKVNFCKFTNETRNGIEDATNFSGQIYIAAVNGSCAGGGYELALACDKIVLLDDGSSSVALPEIPLLAVLPGTGGLTRLSDKRKIRRDRADFFCTLEEGLRGKRALEWNLVDAIAPLSTFTATVDELTSKAIAKTQNPPITNGVTLSPVRRECTDQNITYEYITTIIDRSARTATITIRVPQNEPTPEIERIYEAGDRFWPLQLARELDDVILHLRMNELEIGVWLLRTEGQVEVVAAYDELLNKHRKDWFVNEITLYLKRVFKRLDVTSRSIFSLIEPGSCFIGTLLELALASDRSYMLDGQFEGDNRPEASLRVTKMNFGAYPMSNNLTRLQSRFLDDENAIAAIERKLNKNIKAAESESLGLVTFAPDDIDWYEEVRIAIEERAAFSPDAMTGMESNLRFGGPETMESKIFSRLSAWQNWIFQRPNAVGEKGALSLYGSGQQSVFNIRRT